MNHGECLKALADRGASTESIRMVAAFLSDRSAKVKINSTLSSGRLVTGGAPQGTKMGNFLFTVTIEGIEEKTRTLEGSIPPAIEDDYEDEDELGLRRLAREVSCGPVQRINSRVQSSTPCKLPSQTDALRYDDESGRINTHLSDYGLYELEHTATEDDSWVDKFVDDVTGGQTLRMDKAMVHLSAQKEKRLILAGKNQELYNTIVENSDRIGMKVNGLKTQLLCINPLHSCEAASYINIDNKRVKSGDSLKILGFVFGPNPGIHEHLKHIQKNMQQDPGASNI